MQVHNVQDSKNPNNFNTSSECVKTELLRKLINERESQWWYIVMYNG